MSTKRGGLLTVGVMVAFFATAGTAYAQMPDDASSVDQYVEQFPSAGGPTFAGGGSGGSGSSGGSGGTPVPLAASIRGELVRLGGPEGGTLEAIATQPQLGAPGKNRAGGREARETREAIESAGAQIDSDGGTSPADTFSSVVSAAEGGDPSRLIAIVALLVGIAGAIAVAAALRQRRRSS